MFSNQGFGGPLGVVSGGPTPIAGLRATGFGIEAWSAGWLAGDAFAALRSTAAVLACAVFVRWIPWPGTGPARPQHAPALRNNALSSRRVNCFRRARPLLVFQLVYQIGDAFP